MFGRSSEDSPPEIPSPQVDTYTRAYSEVLGGEALVELDDQKTSFAHFITRAMLRPSLLRFFSDRLSLPKKLEYLEELMEELDLNHKNYSENELNNLTMLSFKDDEALRDYAKHHKKTDLFPKGEEDEWPVLAITSNSNLVSPQVFYDGFSAARKLIPRVTGEHDDDKIIVMGTYFSKEHALANAKMSLSRISTLKKNQDDIDNHISPAARIQAGQLLNLLVERDDNGNVITKEGKRLLRDDADKIMKRVVGYGYSGGHLTNKDSFRLLRHILEKGHLMVKRVNGSTSFRPSDVSDAQKILPNARLIGVAGADGFCEIDRNMPREVNFLSAKDRIVCVHDREFRNSPSAVMINPPRITILTRHPISDHDQTLYVDGLLAEKNQGAIEKARDILSRPSHTSLLRVNPARTAQPTYARQF